MQFLLALKSFCKRIFLAILIQISLTALLLYAKLSGKKILIIALKYGRLGNRLFLFSHIIAYAIENNFEVFNPAFSEYANFFTTTGEDFFCRYPYKKTLFLKKSRILREFFYKIIHNASQYIKNIPKNKYFQTIQLEYPEEMDLSSEYFLRLAQRKKIIFICGWLFRDAKNIVKHADKIREYFIPQEKYKEAISAPIESLRESCEILFGVAIRHGDYRNLLDGKFFYSIDTYVKIMHQLKNLFPCKKVGFFICSDEEQDIRKFSDFNYIFRVKQDLENRYSLAQCDYIVSPPSTYAGWAAFYGNVPIYLAYSPEADISLNSFQSVLGQNTWKSFGDC